MPVPAGWKYYNHAVLPLCAPHQEADTRCIDDGSVWKADAEGRRPLFARWTSDFDCGRETQWWYCIKDEPFDISKLKAKRRYVVNQGRKLFEVRKITPAEYAEELFAVQSAAYEAYPAEYRPRLEHDGFAAETQHWQGTVYAAFCLADGRLCGYSILKEHGDWISLSVQKTIPEYEKYQVNAALIYKILSDYEAYLNTRGGYLSDGERNVFHKTAFQDYLEKYFGFRKAYCCLHIEYCPAMKAAVKLLYPFRSVLEGLGSVTARRAAAVLKMEAIARKDTQYE